MEEIEGRHDLTHLASSLRVSFDAETGLTAEVNGPDEHRLRSFLIDARRLFLKVEDTDLDVILPLAAKHVADPTARKAILDPAEHYRRIRAQGLITLVINGEELHPADLTDLILHGTIFHGTAGKQLRLGQLTKEKPEVREMIEDQMLRFVYRVVEIGIWVGSVIRNEDAAGRLR
jgi:hypothetical protein